MSAKKSKAKESATTAGCIAPTVYVASRVRDASGSDTDDFAVFYETDDRKTVNSAVSPIYKTKKEAEDRRDRLNVKFVVRMAAAA